MPGGGKVIFGFIRAAAGYLRAEGALMQVDSREGGEGCFASADSGLGGEIEFMLVAYCMQDTHALAIRSSRDLSTSTRQQYAMMGA